MRTHVSQDAESLWLEMLLFLTFLPAFLSCGEGEAQAGCGSLVDQLVRCVHSHSRNVHGGF